MKKVLVTCSALLLVASIGMLAQDNINLNQGSETEYLAVTRTPHGANPAGCVGFYDNICGAGYNGGIGWKVNDRPPVELSPAMQFTASKSGTSSEITLGLTYVTGTNAAVGILTEDCGGAPCTDPDGQPEDRQLCAGKVSNMPKFGSTHTITVTFDCRAQISRGQKYWVFLQSLENSGLAWNHSNSATGHMYEGKNDSWVNFGTEHLSALTVQ